MTIKVYSVVQHNEWANPGMWIAVDKDGFIVWNQTNPNYDATRTWFDEDRDRFNITHYKSATFVYEYEEQLNPTLKAALVAAFFIFEGRHVSHCLNRRFV